MKKYKFIRHYRGKFIYEYDTKVLIISGNTHKHNFPFEITDEIIQFFMGQDDIEVLVTNK